MAESDLSMQVDGMDELIESFETMVKKYPDRAGELLVKQAKDLRKDVVKMVKNDTDVDSHHKRSLGNLKEYKISQVKGYLDKQYVEVSGVAPHFHLIENGHDIVTPKTRTIKTKDDQKEKITLSNGGKSVGYAAGYHFMDRAGKKRQIEIPKELEKVVEKLLKEEELI